MPHPSCLIPHPCPIIHSRPALTEILFSKADVLRQRQKSGVRVKSVWLRLILPYLKLSCLVLSWLGLAWLGLAWLGLSCLVVSCRVLSCLVSSRLVLSCLFLFCPKLHDLTNTFVIRFVVIVKMVFFFIQNNRDDLLVKGSKSVRL